MERYKFMYLGLLLLLPFQVFSQTTDNPYPPSQTPDRINLTVTEDPSTSMAVTWRTNTSVDHALAEIVKASPNPLSVNKARQIPAQTEILATKDGKYKSLTWKGVTAQYHSVVFTDLQPNTMYSYRVGSKGHWSEWFQFKTAGKNNDPFSFVYFGDVHAGVGTSSQWAKVIRQAYAQAPDARAILYAGDLVDRANRDEGWGEFFEAGSPVMAMIPNIPSPGNHDYGRGKAALHLSTFWRPEFTLPENGPKGLEETCYFTDIQGVRFISLTTYMVDMIQDMQKTSRAGKEKVEAMVDQWYKKQKTWLNRILKNNPNKWTCIVFHHPIYSPKASRDNKRLRETFKPVFDRYKVDLVLQGHDHTYARGMKNIPMEKGIEPGTMYVVSVSGSKMYSKDKKKKKWMDKWGAYTQLYQIITVDGDELRFRAYTVTGDLFDGFDLIKQPGKVNKIVELPLRVKD